MSIVFVNQAGANNLGTGTATVTVTAPLPGNHLFALISTATAILNIVQTNVTWVKLASSGKCELWMGHSIKLSPGTSIAITNTSGDIAANVAQFKGFCGIPVLDGAAATNSGVGTSLTSGTTATTTATADLFLTVWGLVSSPLGTAGGSAATNGYTILANQSGGGGPGGNGVCGAYLVPNATGTVNSGCLLTSDTTYAWDTLAVAIKNPPPVIQQVGATVSGASIAVSVLSTIAGSFLTMVVGAPSGFTVSSVADNKGNTWVQRQTLTNTTTGYFYDCINAIGGVTTVTVTLSGSTFPAVIFREYDAGLLGMVIIDPSIGVTALGTSTAAASGNTSPNAITTEIIFGWAAASTAVVESAGTGYGFFAYQTSASLSIGLEHLQVSAISVQASAFTLASSHAWVCGCVMFELVVPSGSMPMSIYPAFTLVTL